MDNNSLSHTTWNCKYHIHMLVEIPPKMSVSEFVGYLTSMGTAISGAEDIYIDTVGKNAKKIQEYIQNQL